MPIFWRQHPKPKQSEHSHNKIKYCTIALISIIFSVFVTLYYLLARIIEKITPKCSYLHEEAMAGANLCLRKQKQAQVPLKGVLQVIVNSTISLLLVVLINGFSEHFVASVELISHQTHLTFLSLIFPKMPQLIVVFRPNILPLAIIIVNYLGMTAQICLAIDLIYIFNFPTILLYRFLAKAYIFLLARLRFPSQLITQDHQTWITKQPAAGKLHDLMFNSQGRILAFGLIIVLAQLLLVVSFYYIWLALVITVLAAFLNILHNIKILFSASAQIILILKGYTSSGRVSRLWILITQQIDWKPVLRIKDLQRIACGKNILVSSAPTSKAKSHPTQQQNLGYSFMSVYRSFERANISELINQEMEESAETQ